MSRTLRALALAPVVALAVVAPAAAALPTADATYAGDTSEDGGSVTIKVDTTHLISKVEVVDSCGTTTTFKHVKVKDSGKFHKAIKNDFGIAIYSVSGKFTSKKSATGTFSQVACTGADATFTAQRQ